MKKTISYAIALCLCAALFACGNTASEQPAQTEKAPETTTTTTTAETTTTTVTTTEAPETTTPEPETEPADESEEEDGMYPMEECIRRVIRDNLGQEVVSFEDAEHQYQFVMYFANTENGEKVLVSCLKDMRNEFENGELTSIERYDFGERQIDGVTYNEVTYIPQM